MEKTIIKNAYRYETICPDCGKKIPIHLALSDFYEPIIKKCKCCDALYWYDEDDVYYIQPLEAQVAGKVCEKCKSDLSKTLVPTHTHIKCCNKEFSLDIEFPSNKYDDYKVEEVEAYLLYS